MAEFCELWGLNFSPDAVLFPRSSSPYQEADTRSSPFALLWARPIRFEVGGLAYYNA
jgi:hypothetical protein